ncbi:ATP-binding protein [Mycobacterium sp. ITM-2016-00318]|uniref:ATP-binding protein n=1 Tax=Mycobacterium sp. ITM-2016-00318 TaxID=2099693 RepID=UPI001304DEA6|nr:ATP-binding protein [Mycobacterium sp. ITM-2016-00318]WNG93672.1 ATP-binding protein [Mycobacterium sp. ITM-2016-00318]
MTEETLDLTPSPRILDVIADVDMSVEECLAELIDNALDEIYAAQREDPGFEGHVEIAFPYGSDKVDPESEISVTDTGRGMSLDQMRQALRAGSSGNARYGSLGLFGMGFNVATGRLGYSTTVKSGRADDDHWTIAVVDIQAMGSQDSFQVPISTEPKSIGEHGTSVSVSRLRADTVKRLRWPSIANRVKSRLGETYSYMLRAVGGTEIAGAEVIGGLGVGLTLNGSSVKPHIPCIWSPERSVAYKGQDVPAVTEVRHELKPAFACLACGHWHSETIADLESCVECGSHRVEMRDRVIRGWLGIQRYDDTNDFGISLLRQGRTIVHLDKALFEWSNPDTGEKFVEYPFELGRGRIVGELHLDHVPVNYRKTDFGRDNVAWNTVRDKIRGDGPLKEQLAKQLDYGLNTSQLGMLAHAYRRYDPGYRYLVPGDGSKALAELARKWGQYFRDGLSDYQSDDMWWKNVVRHEEIKAGLADDDDDEDDVEDLLPSSGGAQTDEQTSDDLADDDADEDDAAVPETRDERLARYRVSGRVMPQLDGAEIVIPGRSRTIGVTAYITAGVELIEGPDKFSSMNLEASMLELFIDEKHPLLADFGWNPVDVAAIIVHDAAAAYLGYDGNAGHFIERVLDQVGDRRVDASAIRLSAEGLLDEIREATRPIVESDPAGVWATLSPTAKTTTQKSAAMMASADWDALEGSGGFAEFLSPRAFEDLVVELPERVLDGGVFTTSYGSWQDESIREEKLSHLTSLIRDLDRTLAASDRMSSRELIRLSIGLESLRAMVTQQATT